MLIDAFGYYTLIFVPIELVEVDFNPMEHYLTRLCVLIP